MQSDAAATPVSGQGLIPSAGAPEFAVPGVHMLRLAAALLAGCVDAGAQRQQGAVDVDALLHPLASVLGLSEKKPAGGEVVLPHPQPRHLPTPGPRGRGLRSRGCDNPIPPWEAQGGRPDYTPTAQGLETETTPDSAVEYHTARKGGEVELFTNVEKMLSVK